MIVATVQGNEEVGKHITVKNGKKLQVKNNKKLLINYTIKFEV